MKELKSQANVFYTYSIGTSAIKSVASSNLNTINLREVNLITKKYFHREKDEAIFSIIISNVGSYQAEKLIVNDDMEGLSLIESSLKVSTLKEKDIKSSYYIKENSLIIEVDHLNELDALYISYHAEIATHSPITSSAIIYSDNLSPIETNKVTIENGQAELIISKKSACDYTYYNTDITYIMSLENVGSLKAKDVEVVDNLPATFELRSTDPITLNNSSCKLFDFDSNKHILKIYIPEVKVNEKIIIKIHGQIVK